MPCLDIGGKINRGAAFFFLNGTGVLFTASSRDNEEGNSKHAPQKHFSRKFQRNRTRIVIGHIIYKVFQPLSSFETLTDLFW